MTEQNPMNEKLRAINYRMTKERLRFWDEVRLVPRWLKVLALVFVVGGAILLPVLNAHDPKAPPQPVLVLLGALAGLALGCYAMLAGYVNRDAQRRGMRSTLWTLLVIFVPDAIGFVIYFLMREPLQFTCPQCGASVSARFNFCPSCKHNLRPACPQCGHEVPAGGRYCPQCAHDLTASAGTAAGGRRE